MDTKKFWLATIQRVVRTFAQALASLITVSMVGAGFDIVRFAWGYSLSVSAGAAFYALLTCVIASKSGDSDSPAFGNVEK